MDSIYNNPYYVEKPKNQVRTQESMGPDQQGSGWQQTASQIGAGLASAVPEQDRGRFEIDPNAGYTGSLKGFASGGPVGAIIGGIGSQVGNFSKVNRAIKDLDTTVDGYQYDENGQIQFNGQAYTQAIQDAGDLQKGIDSIGKSKDPATYLFAAAYGTKKKARRKQDELSRGYAASQMAFNQGNIAQKRQQLAQQQYQDLISKRNVYNIPMSYY